MYLLTYKSAPVCHCKRCSNSTEGKPVYVTNISEGLRYHLDVVYLSMLLHYLGTRPALSFFVYLRGGIPPLPL